MSEAVIKSPFMEASVLAVSYDLLPKVSRSFALAITELPEPCRSYICTAYLLCRVVDTIEDHPSPLDKSKYFDQFDRCLLKIEDWDELSFDLLEKLNPPQSWDRELLEKSKLVFALFNSYPKPVKEILKKNIYEMSVGMRSYTGRGGQTAITLKDTADLDRYCYYVAGTVGNLLTEIFTYYYGITDPQWIERQKVRGYHFAQGLQKVNMIRDVIADLKRGSIFIPQQWMDQFGLTREDLLQGISHPKVKALLDFFVSHTADHLEKARDYILELPLSPAGIRLFCIWPYAMALDTLRLLSAQSPPPLSESPVKVSRAQMFRMMAVTKILNRSSFGLKWYLNRKLSFLPRDIPLKG